MKPEETVGKYVIYDSESGAVWAKISGYYEMANGEIWLNTSKLIVRNTSDKKTFTQNNRSLNFKSLINNNARFFDLTADIIAEIQDVALLDFLGADNTKALFMGATEMMKDYNKPS